MSVASVAGVALLLCANSALIQKLFYAVNRTCDRQRGGKERSGEKGGGGEARQHFFRLLVSLAKFTTIPQSVYSLTCCEAQKINKSAVKTNR